MFPESVDKELIELPKSSGEGATVHWTANCDGCARFTYFAHAMIHCRLDGTIRLENTSPRIRIAKLAIKDAYESEGFEYNDKDDRFHDPKGLLGGVSNFCYECYGEKFKDDKLYFVNEAENKLKASWYNLRKKTQFPSQKVEDRIVTYLFEKALNKIVIPESRTILLAVYRTILERSYVAEPEESKIENCSKRIRLYWMCYLREGIDSKWLQYESFGSY